VAAHGAQSERIRRIDVLLPAASDDAEFQARVGAFLQGLLAQVEKPGERGGAPHPIPMESKKERPPYGGPSSFS
jgi:hypothetical protein